MKRREFLKALAGFSLGAAAAPAVAKVIGVDSGDPSGAMTCCTILTKVDHLSEADLELMRRVIDEHAMHWTIMPRGVEVREVRRIS